MRYRTDTPPFICRGVLRIVNCRPNDLAVLVRNTARLDCMAVQMGLVLRVGFPVISPYGTAWMRRGSMWCPMCGGFDVFLDADLQPIRGDGDRHETVREILAGETADDLPGAHDLEPAELVHPVCGGGDINKEIAA